MKQSERRLFLIRTLLAERPQYHDIGIPADEKGQRQLLRSLLNVRAPAPIGDDFLRVQDEYLQARLQAKGVTDLSSLTPIEPGIYLWQGDITTLRCDAIVNAANSGMTGCYQPCHTCIDNCIHTFAGVQLRNCCDELMRAQGHEEPTGQAKITPGFNLPCKYVLHTVDPIVNGRLTETHKTQLADCYCACLTLAEEYGCQSIAFCCISTGVFGFPQQEAAQIAVQTVRDCKANATNQMEVIFNVFKDVDYEIYRNLLTKHQTAQTRD